MSLTDAELAERINRRVPPTSALLGMSVVAVDQAAGTVRLRFEPKAEFANPMGNVQGGFVVAMLDDAAALAAVVKAGQRIVVPTIELKTSFFGVARIGAPLFAEGRCVKLGQRIAFMEADLRDDAGTLLARLSTTALPTPLDGPGNFVERP
ncbi:MAG: PaaI family thioesterase [Sphingomonadaceae bacterium]|nr:PaaI family thioesterase [Sphingomonadaceae bacterium]